LPARSQQCYVVPLVKGQSAISILWSEVVECLGGHTRRSWGILEGLPLNGARPSAQFIFLMAFGGMIVLCRETIKTTSQPVPLFSPVRPAPLAGPRPPRHTRRLMKYRSHHIRRARSRPESLIRQKEVLDVNFSRPTSANLFLTPRCLNRCQSQVLSS